MKTLLSLNILLILPLLASTQAQADYSTGMYFYRQGNFAKAVVEFQKDGGPEANFCLSVMYQKGEGTAQNGELSLRALKKAAEQGLDVAQADLGLMYMDGMTVERNEAEGIKWLRKAADNGLEEARAAMESMAAMR